MSRIDVVVPCHNYADYLRECVTSVTRQSHRDLRVLIIDDGSVDDTPRVAEALSAEDSRVEVRRHPLRHGHIETYNEGIAWAEGDYWLLLSADDFLLPGALQRAAGALDTHSELGLVYGAFIEFSMGRPLPFRAYRRLGLTRPTATAAEQEDGSGAVTVWEASDFVAALAEGASVGVSTAVARVAVQRRVGGYRSELPHTGDLEMWLRFAIESKVGFIDALQAVYRVHGRNMSIDYRGYRDFSQRVLAFEMRQQDIVDRLPDGEALVRRIKRANDVRAAKSALRSLLSGRLRDTWRLCSYPLRRAAASKTFP